MNEWMAGVCACVQCVRVRSAHLLCVQRISAQVGGWSLCLLATCWISLLLCSGWDDARPLISILVPNTFRSGVIWHLLCVALKSQLRAVKGSNVSEWYASGRHVRTAGWMEIDVVCMYKCVHACVYACRAQAMVVRPWLCGLIVHTSWIYLHMRQAQYDDVFNDETSIPLH